MSPLLPLLLGAPDAVPAVIEGAGLGARIAFFALAALTVGGALITVTRRNAISAVMALVASFFGLAGLYLMLSAQFLAAIQVLVYAGAIMTLFVFVVMVLNREEAEPWALRGLLWKVLGAAAVLYLAVQSSRFLFADIAAKPGLPPEGFGGVADVGELLFTKYLFPFEALSLMLLVAVIGAVVVARSTKEAPPSEDHAGGLAHRRREAGPDAPGAGAATAETSEARSPEAH